MRLRSLLATSVFVAGLAIGQTALAQTTVTFWQFFTGDTDVAAWRDAIARFPGSVQGVVVQMTTQAFCSIPRSKARPI